ncbi:hypothetical protein Acr_03g0008400 [Actinidia rufa]|uniref:Uncharacterized protein n=1 Tax=Actinidia rufa TaxID=165716 RepID=A0A7J0ECZ6_9ERIC|nr:hypothetical protein Acr_03g0008400 [Actinidia rufa]
MMNKFQERNAKLLEEANSTWYMDNRKLRPGEGDDDDAQEKVRTWDDWKEAHPMWVRAADNFAHAFFRSLIRIDVHV